MLISSTFHVFQACRTCKEKNKYPNFVRYSGISILFHYKPLNFSYHLHEFCFPPTPVLWKWHPCVARCCSPWWLLHHFLPLGYCRESSFWMRFLPPSLALVFVRSLMQKATCPCLFCISFANAFCLARVMNYYLQLLLCELLMFWNKFLLTSIYFLP